MEAKKCKIFNLIKKYYLFFTFLIISLLFTVTTGKYTGGSLRTIFIFSIYAVMLVYFVVFFQSLYLKFIRKKQPNSKISVDKIFFLISILYCFIIFVYRFFAKLDAMEGAHYAIRLIGAISILYVVINDESKCIKNNLMLYAGLLDVAFLIDFVINKSFRKTNILANVLVVGCVMLILNFICLSYLRNKTQKNYLYDSICYFHLFTMILSVALSGSRLMLIVGFVVIAYDIIAIAFSKNKQLKYVLTTCLASLLMVVILYGANFGDVRYYVNKQIMTILPTAFENTDLTEPDSELDSSTMANDIKNLEKASDSKREQLQKYGIKQFKQNVLFGNGNVLYDYKNPENPEKGGQSASAHNFIIEFLVAFGIIGTLLFVAWFVFLFIPIIFNKKTSWWEKFDILILLFVIVSFGFVQQMLFNFIVLPIFAATIGALLTNKIDFICFKKTFKNKKIDNKQISK